MASHVIPLLWLRMSLQATGGVQQSKSAALAMTGRRSAALAGCTLAEVAASLDTLFRGWKSLAIFHLSVGDSNAKRQAACSCGLLGQFKAASNPAGVAGLTTASIGLGAETPLLKNKLVS
jgi:hypothetical protein